jgi:hypothetical protein
MGPAQPSLQMKTGLWGGGVPGLSFTVSGTLALLNAILPTTHKLLSPFHLSIQGAVQAGSKKLGYRQAENLQPDPLLRQKG